jgi:hypothetical protein
MNAPAEVRTGTCQALLDSRRSPVASSAGKPRWPGCVGSWIRSRMRARSCSSPARRAWARPCSLPTQPGGPGRRACGSYRSPAGNRESKLAFAGLHQLLRPVLSGAADLPARQGQALLGALGLAADPIAPDPLLTGAAVLTLLSDLSERSPVLVVADDAQWLDRSSLDALAFAGSRLDAERVVLLVGARGRPRPPGLTGDSRNCTLSRCPRRTPAACWTRRLGHLGGGPGRRCSPRPGVIRWR